MIVAARQFVAILIVAGKGLLVILIVADGFEDLGRGERRWPPWSRASGFSSSSPIAFNVHLEDRRVMHEPVDSGERHGWVREDLVPLAEGLVCVSACKWCPPDSVIGA